MASERPESYGSYLHLDRILGAQAPLSNAHDELLFIIQHQTSELWMKLAIHEIRSAMAELRADRLEPAFKMLTRVARIFEQLNGAWDVLRTMTPSEYTQFRDCLGQTSGFQSWQYRAIEYLAGNRNLGMLGLHAERPQVMADLETILAEPSLYDEALLLLARNGFDIGEDAQRVRRELEAQAIDELVRRHPVDLSPRLTGYMLEQVVHEQTGHREVAEDLHKQLEEHYRPGVERSLRREILLAALARQEGLEVTPDEVGAQVQRLADSDPKNAARVRQHYASAERRRSLAESILERKALDLVIGASQLKEEAVPAGAA